MSDSEDVVHEAMKSIHPSNQPIEAIDVLDFLKDAAGPFVVIAYTREPGVEDNRGMPHSVVGPFDTFEQANMWRLQASLHIDEEEQAPFTLGLLTTLDNPIDFHFGDPDV